MKRVLLICGLTLTNHTFADQNDSFENEYLKIMEESNVAQHKEFKFKETHKDNELNEVEKVEAKQLKCASLLSEQRFYELVNKRSKEYVNYMKQQGLNVHFDLVKSNNELRKLKQEVRLNQCDEEQINY